jgi:hypothetical protein
MTAPLPGTPRVGKRPQASARCGGDRSSAGPCSCLFPACFPLVSRLIFAGLAGRSCAVHHQIKHCGSEVFCPPDVVRRTPGDLVALVFSLIFTSTALVHAAMQHGGFSAAFTPSELVCPQSGGCKLKYHWYLYNSITHVGQAQITRKSGSRVAPAPAAPAARRSSRRRETWRSGTRRRRRAVLTRLTLFLDRSDGAYGTGRAPGLVPEFESHSGRLLECTPWGGQVR